MANLKKIIKIIIIILICNLRTKSLAYKDIYFLIIINHTFYTVKFV
jgi:hypothetical protein